MSKIETTSKVSLKLPSWINLDLGHSPERANTDMIPMQIWASAPPKPSTPGAPPRPHGHPPSRCPMPRNTQRKKVEESSLSQPFLDWPSCNPPCNLPLHK